MRPFRVAVFGLLSAALIAPYPVRAWFGSDLWDAGKDIVEGGVNAAGDAANAIGGLFSGDGTNYDVACRRYAAQAVAEVQKGNDQHCGFANTGRFSGDYAAHLNWCTARANDGDFDTVMNEQNTRNRAVSECSSCKSYADRAVSQARDNEMYHCGGIGPQWSTSFQDQLHRCIGSDGGFAQLRSRIRFASASPVNSSPIRLAFGELLPPPNAESELNSRQNFVDACKGRYPPEDVVYCKAYAERAVKNATIYESRQCDPNQPPTGRFSEDYAFHFAWCILAQNEGLRDGEDQARIQAVEACELTHPPRDCKSCHSTVSGGASSAQMPVSDHTLFSNISAAVQAALVSGGGFDTTKSPSKVVPPVTKKQPAVRRAHTKKPPSGGFDKSTSPKRRAPVASRGNSAMDRLGGSSSIDNVSGNRGGPDAGTRRAPCPTCGTVKSGTKTQPRSKSPPKASDTPIDYGGMSGRPPPDNLR